MIEPEKGDKDIPGEKPFTYKLIPGYVKAYLVDVIDLRKGVNAQITIADIKNKRSMSGANAWMLMCSIVIASIGLSQNSQALIIGAMLISPLMSPILGIGLSVGINDMETLRSSLVHMSIAVFIAVLTSYIYFEISPFDDLTSEIRARTKPTFLDIFVAIFGGIAGIISIARKDISTTLPGVAIATALMPPLCVTGYGLATRNWEIASASFYLFFLNTFFVALSTYIIVRLLKFPYRQYVDKKTRIINIFKISIFSLAVVIPSFFIFKNVLQELRLKRNLEAFKNICLKENAIYLDSYKPDKDTLGNKILFLKVYGNAISQERESEYIDCLNSLGVSQYSLRIISTSEVRLDDIELLECDLESIADQLEESKNERNLTSQLINYYEFAHLDTSAFDQIKDELKVLYPDIAELGLAKVHLTDFEVLEHDFPTILIKWNGIRPGQIQKNNQLIQNFMKTRLRIDSIRLINY